MKTFVPSLSIPTGVSSLLFCVFQTYHDLIVKKCGVGGSVRDRPWESPGGRFDLQWKETTLAEHLLCVVFSQ